MLFEDPRAAHLVEGIETVDEPRPALAWRHFAGGANHGERAGEIADPVVAHGGGNRRLAADHCGILGVRGLGGHGVEAVDGQGPMAEARQIESADEIECMRHAVAVCEAGMARMRDPLSGGVTENEL